MFNIIVRVIIIYLIVIALMRLMGKRQIGEMEPFELVITLIIADLATIPMAEPTIPLWYGVVPLIAITIMHFVISFATQKSPAIRDVISGKPAIVINEGSINQKELKKLNMSSEELLEQLRNLNYFDLGEVNFAIIERNGKITIIPKSESMPITREDMQIKTEQTDMPYCIIENGKYIKRNWKELGVTSRDIMDNITNEMMKTISTTGAPAITHLKQISFASASRDGNAHIQTKFGELRNIQINLPVVKELPTHKTEVENPIISTVLTKEVSA